MTQKIIFILVLLSFGVVGLAQENEPVPKDKPVRDPWASGYLIDNQTTMIPAVNTLEYVIQHRFGDMSNGINDLFGIYAPGANVRIGFNYVILKNVQIGYGLTKKNMYSDFNLKWTILEQTRRNTIPVSLGLYGNFAIDSREKATFGKNYEFTNRLSYFSQLIVGRKFGNWLSIQSALSFSHYNAVEPALEHDKIGLHFSGRAKFSPTMSFIFNYDIPLKIKGISEHLTFTDHPKPNLAAGLEIATSTHAFQIFVGSSTGLLPQDIIMYNQADWTAGKMSFGFVITRLWNF
jgi:hypothetical protein